MFVLGTNIQVVNIIYKCGIEFILVIMPRKYSKTEDFLDHESATLQRLCVKLGIRVQEKKSIELQFTKSMVNSQIIKKVKKKNKEHEKLSDH